MILGNIGCLKTDQNHHLNFTDVMSQSITGNLVRLVLGLPYTTAIVAAQVVFKTVGSSLRKWKYEQEFSAPLIHYDEQM